MPKEIYNALITILSAQRIIIDKLFDMEMRNESVSPMVYKIINDIDESKMELTISLED